MNRSSRAQQMLALAVVLAFVVGLAVTVASPATAEAQDNAGASLTLQASPIVQGQLLRTVAVALEPGQTGLAALGAALVYDTDAVVVSSCAVSEVGACNVTDQGKVLVSVFNLSGLSSNEQLLTINFEAALGANGNTSFEVIVNTAVPLSGEHLADITGDTLEIVVAAPTFGSLTGTVIAEDSETGLYAVGVCLTHDLTGHETCTTSSGLGNWRVDDLAAGTYAVAATDATGVYAAMVGSDRVVEGQIFLSTNSS